jgi:hypothetical protein
MRIHQSWLIALALALATVSPWCAVNAAEGPSVQAFNCSGDANNVSWGDPYPDLGIGLTARFVKVSAGGDGAKGGSGYVVRFPKDEHLKFDSVTCYVDAGNAAQAIGFTMYLRDRQHHTYKIRLKGDEQVGRTKIAATKCQEFAPTQHFAGDEHVKDASLYKLAVDFQSSDPNQKAQIGYVEVSFVDAEGKQVVVVPEKIEPTIAGCEILNDEP